MKIGVVIGRFQVPELTVGHRYLIDTAMSFTDKLYIFLGVSEAQTKRNPLTYEIRKAMIETEYSTYGNKAPTILPLKDHPNDRVWAAQVNDELIKNHHALGSFLYIFGSRDSCLETYAKAGGQGATIALGAGANWISGSFVRANLVPVNSPEFRAGMIYKSENEFPRAYPCVDVIIKRWSHTGEGGQGHHLMYLMARKPTDTPGKWRFVGGFVDPTDINLEYAAKREALEETGLEVSMPTYVGSTRIDDWRYRKSVEKVVSSLFVCSYVFGREKANDDISELKWFSLDEVKQVIHPVHSNLLAIYLRSLNESNSGN